LFANAQLNQSHSALVPSEKIGHPITKNSKNIPHTILTTLVRMQHPHKKKEGSALCFSKGQAILMERYWKPFGFLSIKYLHQKGQ